MNNNKIGKCPICGGEDFSPLAAGKYMCTQCGYVISGNSDSSQTLSSSSDSVSESDSSSQETFRSPLEEHSQNEANIRQIKCPRCGSVVDGGGNFCPKCGFCFSQDDSSFSQETEESQLPYDDEPEHGAFRKILKWIGITILVLWGSIFVLFLFGSLVEMCSTDKDSSMVDSVSVDSAEAKVVTKIWGQVVLEGEMYDEEGNVGNIQVTYETDGTNVRNCIYKNVDLGGKIRMSLDVSDDAYSFSGKDGNNKFAFTINKDELIGPGHDGKKNLLFMLHKEGEPPAAKPAPVDMSLWDPNFGYINVKGQIGYFNTNMGDNTSYILRVISYNKETGKCVIEAYLQDKTIGKFIGNYSMSDEVLYDAEGDSFYVENYNGKFYYANGKERKFDFWPGD